MLSKKSIDHAETIRDATTHLNDIKSALPQKVINIFFSFSHLKKKKILSGPLSKKRYALVIIIIIMWKEWKKCK